MPVGIVKWFDPKSGTGRIRRFGREYVIDVADIEPAARVPRARVHFDALEHGGVHRAINVTLRRGKRTSPRHHDFGSLDGARHPDEKGHHPLTDDHPGMDWAFEGHPKALVETWARLVARGDFATARMLYAPHASLHVDHQEITGRDAVVERLEQLVSGRAVRFGVARGDDPVVVAFTAGTKQHSVRTRVEHGQIVEQRM